MKEDIKEKILKNKEIIMYIIVGGCTTLVNLLSYAFFYEKINLGVNISNTLSVICAIIFAYFANKTLVFESKTNGFIESFKEFIKFIMARSITMLIEIGGVYILATLMSQNPYLSKIGVQIIVLIVNYILTKYIVFK